MEDLKRDTRLSMNKKSKQKYRMDFGFRGKNYKQIYKKLTILH